MKTEAEQRSAAVAAVNGTTANFNLARDRLAKAVTAVADIEVIHDRLLERYATARVILTHSECSAEQRLEQIEVVNECLSKIEANKAERQRAKSEEGTAKALVGRLDDERTACVVLLAKLLPEIP
jgi:hypothetical protein